MHSLFCADILDQNTIYDRFEGTVIVKQESVVQKLVIRYQNEQLRGLHSYIYIYRFEVILCKFKIFCKHLIFIIVIYWCELSQWLCMNVFALQGSKEMILGS